jgi:hypothetical protein
MAEGETFEPRYNLLSRKVRRARSLRGSSNRENSLRLCGSHAVMLTSPVQVRYPFEFQERKLDVSLEDVRIEIIPP